MLRSITRPSLRRPSALVQRSRTAALREISSTRLRGYKFVHRAARMATAHSPRVCARLLTFLYPQTVSPQFGRLLTTLAYPYTSPVTQRYPPCFGAFLFSSSFNAFLSCQYPLVFSGIHRYLPL